MEWVKRAGVITSALVVAGILVHNETAKLDNGTDNKATLDSITPPYFPAAISFAGEQAPLQIADVHERLDRELLVNANLHASTQLILKRAKRSFTVIEPILKQYGVPDDFKYLSVCESGLTNAISPAGAKGFWQFMPDTGKQYGLEVTDEVDERYHLAKSTEAACKYLIAAKERFGSWTLAAASYNAGLAGVNRLMSYQGVDNYYDLLLADETSRYVFRILALKEIMEHPHQYNFYLDKNESYPVIPVKEVIVHNSIPDLAVFAKEQGINYKILKIHNPWLRDHSLKVAAGKEYTIEIPIAGY